jgi:histidyl-tRNA synthetase
VDVVGSDSLLNEVELIRIIDKVFYRLKMKVTIKLNNRKVLSGMAETIDASDKLIDITTAIDKLDKIGIEKVYEELLSKGISQDAIDNLEPIINLSGENDSKINCLKQLVGDTETGGKGILELESVLNYLKPLRIKSKVEIDQSLARGLNYYTGAIIEVKANDVSIGSICGGGRYDNLTGIFGLPDVSGVGVSFGADRIYDVMSELNLFPKEVETSTEVMFVNFGENEGMHALEVLAFLQQNGIRAELYPDADKMKKQMKYANQRAIPFVVLIGEQEMETKQYTLKNMTTGEQEKLSAEKIVEKVKN